MGSSSRSWQDNDVIRTLQDIKRPLELAGDHYDDEEDDFFDEDQSEEGDDRFFNPALLSHIAVRLRDKVPRGTHVKGSIPYPRAFTGKDIVVRPTPYSLQQRTEDMIERAVNHPVTNTA